MSFDQLTPKAVLRDGLSLIGRFVRGHPKVFALSVAGSVLFAAAIIGSSLVIGWVTDTLIVPVLDDGISSDGLLVPAAAAIMGIALAKSLGIVARRSAAAWFTFKTREDTRNILVDRQLRLRMSWFNQRTTGDLLAVADADTDQSTSVLHPLPYATGVSVLLVGSLVMITLIDVWLGLYSLIGLVLIVGINLRGSWLTYWLWEEVQENRGKVSGLAHESFDGALTIKSLGREDYVADRFQRASDTLRDGLIEVNSLWRSYQAVVKALPQAVILVLLVVGVARIESGALSTGDLVSVAYLFTLLGFPVQFMGFMLWEMAGSLAGWQRVRRVAGADDLMPYGSALARHDRGAAPIEGRGVDFSYDGRSPVLEDLSLDLRPGTTLAVVGPTGSGKSTLTLLLARLWDPDQGEIIIDGSDLREFAVSELPREVAYVAQNAFLFDDTVAGNITLGQKFTQHELDEAVSLAGATDFINQLPDRLDTDLGERGTTLSGGQRQRIALARALIRKPRLLVMDDATSAVDPSVEARILRRLQASDLPSTIILVAYRPSSIRLADEVVYLADHRIIAHGSHEDLVDSISGYGDLVQAYEREASGGKP